jgi:DNA-binding protein H-NS
MAKGRLNLAGMSVNALMSLRDKVSSELRQKTTELRKQLHRLEIGGWGSAQGTAARAKRRKAGKLPPKYRDPDAPSNVWAGRGALPKWMEAKINAGAKREDFLIGSSGNSPRKARSAKKVRKRVKAKAAARKTPRRSRAAPP